MQAPQGNVQKLLGDFWASGLDEAAVEADGAKPIAPLLDRINGIKRAKDVPAAIAALHQVGIPVAFNFGADVDLKALDRHIGYFTQGGLGLPDPAYYTRTDAETRALLGRYRDYVKQILALTGTKAEKLDAEARAGDRPGNTHRAGIRGRWWTCAIRWRTTRRSPPRTWASSTRTCSWTRS